MFQKVFGRSVVASVLEGVSVLLVTVLGIVVDVVEDVVYFLLFWYCWRRRRCCCISGSDFNGGISMLSCRCPVIKSVFTVLGFQKFVFIIYCAVLWSVFLQEFSMLLFHGDM